MGDINASPIDFNSFLATANQYITAMANKAKEKARQTASVTGMGRSGIPGAAAAGIDQATQAQLANLANQVLSQKQTQEEERSAYEEQKKEQQDALDAQKSAGTTMGLSELGGAALGAIAAPFTGGAINPMTGAALGGELGGDIAGLQYGKTPSMSSLATLNQAMQPKTGFNMDDFLKYLKMFGGGDTPLLPAPAGGLPSASQQIYGNIG